MNLNRLPNESFLDWKYRLIEEKVLGSLDADWQVQSMNKLSNNRLRNELSVNEE